MCAVHAVQELKQKLARIRAGSPGTRRAEETMFIMKLTKKDKKGHKTIDPDSAGFRDYLSRYEDTCVVCLFGTCTAPF